MDEKLNTAWQCAPTGQRAKGVLDCIPGREASKLGDLQLTEGGFRLVLEIPVYCEGGKALEQIAQRNCGCPTLETLKTRWDGVLRNLFQ